VGRTARANRHGTAISIVTQYDIELWLRLEAALDKKIEEHKIIKDEAMIFAERVSDAQRVAALEMKDLHEKRGQRGSILRHRKVGKRGRDGMDQDEG
jgi:ATP-dependent RNA helicase DDX47/RRP3